MNVATLFPNTTCFRHDEPMPDWERLGRYVVARRTELRFRSRTDFAAAVQLSARLLADIEKGRRSNFDPVTLAAVEAALGWETGSVGEVLGGGEPRVRHGATAHPSPLPPGPSADRLKVVDEIDLIYASRSMSALQKLEAIRKVLQLRAQAETDQAQADQGDADAQVSREASA